MTIYLDGLSYMSTGLSKGCQVLGMEDQVEDGDHAQPYLINQNVIDMIRATSQDASMKHLKTTSTYIYT